MTKILVVEDDKSMNGFVSTYLRDSGYEVKSCYNGKEALSLLEQEKFSLIISDIMMPMLVGFELASSIRKQNDQIHIIFMSARDDKPSKKLGYKIGIDDYITKPFDLDELVFKVNGIARRIHVNSTSILKIGNFKMDKDEHTSYIDEEELSLTVREFEILYKMLSNPKKTFTRSRLMEDFWGFDTSATSRTVDVYMAKLREKTKNCTGFEIQTVHGLGYKVILK